MWPWERTVDTDERVLLDVPGIGEYEAVVARAVPGAAELALINGPLPARYLAGHGCHVVPSDARAPGPRPPRGAHSADRIDGRLVAVRSPSGGLRDDVVQMVFDVTRQARVPPIPTPAAAGDARRAASAHASPAAAPRGVTGAAAYSAIKPHTPEQQRRVFHRVAIVRPVTLVPARFKVGWLDGQTRDLSEGGALISGAERLREGERLRMVLELGPGAMFDTDGRIVRFDAAGLAGVRWDRLSQDDRVRLQQYIAIRQRAALAELRASA